MEEPVRRVILPSVHWLLILCVAILVVWFSVTPPHISVRMSVGAKLKVNLIGVSDGDTIRVTEVDNPANKHRVRFAYIDAPEMAQPMGKESRQRLVAKFQESSKRQVYLSVVPSKDRYGRTLAVVYFGTENINRWLVEQGLAWVYIKLPCPKEYTEAEAQARGKKLGLWSAGSGSDPKAPWDYRKAKKAAHAARRASLGAGGDVPSAAKTKRAKNAKPKKTTKAKKPKKTTKAKKPKKTTKTKKTKKTTKKAVKAKGSAAVARGQGRGGSVAAKAGQKRPASASSSSGAAGATPAKVKKESSGGLDFTCRIQ